MLTRQDLHVTVSHPDISQEGSVLITAWDTNKITTELISSLTFPFWGIIWNHKLKLYIKKKELNKPIRKWQWRKVNPRPSSDHSSWVLGYFCGFKRLACVNGLVQVMLQAYWNYAWKEDSIHLLEWFFFFFGCYVIGQEHSLNGKSP